MKITENPRVPLERIYENQMNDAYRRKSMKINGNQLKQMKI